MEAKGCISISKNITRQGLLNLGFEVNCYCANILEFKGTDGVHEYIQAFFNEGVDDQIIPNEICVVGLNKDVSICEKEDMTYQFLIDAIMLVFSRDLEKGFQRDILKLVVRLASGKYKCMCSIDSIYRKFIDRADTFFCRVCDVEEEGYITNDGMLSLHFRNEFERFMEDIF